MFTFFMTWLGKLIGGPFIQGAIDLYKAKLGAETNIDTLKAQLATTELQLQGLQEQLQTQYKIATIGRWYEPDHVMAYITAIYYGKLLVWDKVLGWGSTDALSGWAAVVATAVVTYYFGKRGFENVFAILTTRIK